jgi:GT2 family glycosyltransferase
MIVALVTIGYNRPGRTRRLIESAQRACRHDLTSIVFSHSRQPAKLQELERLAQRPDVIYLDYGVNRGLAKSWNEGILLAADKGFEVTLVVNEDVLMGAGDVNRLAEAALERPECLLVMGRAYHAYEARWGPSEYGCFAITPRALSTLGCFDENFFPVYCEDSDYRRRAALAGLENYCCPDTNILHGGGESLGDPALAAQNRVTYQRNREYFIRKWGEVDGHCRFERPFDDPRFGLYIPPQEREAPYPGHNRQDHEIVQV